jgi:hypothetical protein
LNDKFAVESREKQMKGSRGKMQDARGKEKRGKREEAQRA